MFTKLKKTLVWLFIGGTALAAGTVALPGGVSEIPLTSENTTDKSLNNEQSLCDMSAPALESINTVLETKSKEEQPKIKGCEIAKKLEIKKEKRAEVEFEIVEVNPNDKGVEVFARVWDKDKKQFGFGDDGSVDIERFVFVNPPILVPDKAGSIVKTNPANYELGIPTTTTTYREDPKEAILYALEKTIEVKQNKFTSEKIVVEKRGNTTYTIYPTADTNIWFSTNTIGTPTWAAWRGYTGSTGILTDYPSASIPLQEITKQSNCGWRGTRFYFSYDTSSVSGTISAVSTSVTVQSQTNNSYNDGNDFYSITGASLDTPGSIGTGDFDSFSDTEMHDSGERKDMTGISGTQTWTFNSTGIAAINTSGYTDLALREGHDVLNSEPSGSCPTYNRTYFYMSEQTGTSTDPVLVIETTTGGGGEEEEATTTTKTLIKGATMFRGDTIIK